MNKEEKEMRTRDRTRQGARETEKARGLPEPKDEKETVYQRRGSAYFDRFEKALSYLSSRTNGGKSRAKARQREREKSRETERALFTIFRARKFD